MKNWKVQNWKTIGIMLHDGDEKMTKYARIVFEVEIEDNADDEEILDLLESRLGEFIENVWGIDDVEIHNRPYIADECDSDQVL